MEGKEMQNEYSQIHTCFNRRQLLQLWGPKGEKVKKQCLGKETSQKVETCDENKCKYLVSSAFLF